MVILTGAANGKRFATGLSWRRGSGGVVIALLDRSSGSSKIAAFSPVPLDSLMPEARAEIVDLPHGHGALRRLAELGIFMGAQVKVVRIAPLGGPILLDVRGSLVALGRRLAHRIWVRVLA